MARLLIVMLLNLAVARWLYDELALMAPSTVPYVDSALAKMRIPTHDKWDEIDAKQMIASFTETDVAHAEDGDSDLPRNGDHGEADKENEIDWF